MNRGMLHLVALAGAVVLGGGAVLAFANGWRTLLLALVVAAAMGLGYAAGFLRAGRHLPRLAQDLSRLAAGSALPPAPARLRADEAAVFGALGRAAEETERHDRDEALARERALFDSRHDALGRVAAGLAGRFGETLAGAVAALANAERTAQRADHSAALLTSLADARRALDRAGRLVEGLRAIAPAFTPPPSPVAVAEIVRRTIDERRPRAERLGVTFEISVPPSDVEVTAEPSALGGALGPLVDNALDALEPRGGHVAVSVESPRATGEVVVRVEDDGPGVSEDDLERAFDPFYTTRAGADGLGLGLAFARAAAARCGGAVRLERRTGGGLRALVTLPPVHRGTPGLSSTFAIGESPGSDAR